MYIFLGTPPLLLTPAFSISCKARHVHRTNVGAEDLSRQSPTEVGSTELRKNVSH